MSLPFDSGEPAVHASTMIDTLPVLTPEPVVQRDGVIYLRLGEDHLAPLLSAPGKTFASFVPGWSAHLLYAGLGPTLILEFRSGEGTRAAWLLDGGLCRLGDKLADLSPSQAQTLRQHAAPMLRRMAVDILLRPMPVLTREAQAFGQLNDVLRTAIAEFCGDSMLPAPRTVLAADIAQNTAFSSPFGAAPVLLARMQIQAGLATNLEDRVVAATSDGMLSWPSPVDGRPLRCQGCIYFDDFRFAYRFADPASGLVFYVIAADHYCKPLGLYVPQLDLLVARDARCKHLLEVYFPPNLARWFINQAALNGSLLVPYWVRGATAIASVMRGQPGTHLGHQLWNELSGMEYLLTAAQGEQIPNWIIPGARHGIELWGSIEALFPELRGRIVRDLDHASAVMPTLYREGICAVRVTRERVSAELRRRVQRVTAMDPLFAAIRAQAQAARASGAPVIVLGLRVENRTLIDLADFMLEVIRATAAHWPGAIIVIDGHNVRAASENVIESHGEGLAKRPPLDIEREIAGHLRAQTTDLPITLLDTLGAPVASSLAWAMQCDCFLSVWGASLAKFRWVCNKPGLVVSSCANLMRRDDLHIYDSPKYMEQPSTLLFADPAGIIDEPESPRLVPVSPGNPFFSNFRLDHARVVEQFHGLLREVMAQRV